MTTALGIDATQKILVDLTAILINAIQLSKAPFSVSSMTELMALASSGKDLIAEAKPAFAELKDLDSAESLQLGQACLQMVKTVLVSVA